MDLNLQKCKFFIDFIFYKKNVIICMMVGVCMKLRKYLIYIVTIFIGLFTFNLVVFADYQATVLITDGAKCELRSTSTGKCFYKDTNFNSVVPGVVWLDTGDTVTVIEGATYTSNNKSRCDSYYVKAKYAFQSSPNNYYTGYFCNSNLVRVGTVSDNLKNEFRNAGFPESYYSKLAVLKQAHPNWTFRAINTGINFNTAVEEENSLGRSLLEVTSGYNNVGYLNTISGSYNYYNDTFKAFDGSTWYAANKDTIAYYMDPRNFLIDMYVFQFEALAYEKDLQTLSVVQKLLKGDYLNNFSSSFISAASDSKVSPVYLASLSKQEVGGYSTATTAVNGKSFTYNGTNYSGIYNPYNIGAVSGTNPVYNGLYWAAGGSTKATSYNRPWNSMDKAIRGGAIWIGENYINIGQNTIYFKKWDVIGNVNSKAGANYVHQYQTNIQAPMQEGNFVYKSYNESNILNSSFVFYIPVYNNMPASTSLPNTGNPNNYLKSLSINDKNISSFDGGVTNYNYYVSSDTNSVTIKATTVNSNASVSGAGYVSINGDTTKKEITVKAQNGQTRTYTINIIREKKEEVVDTKSITSILNSAGIKNNNSYLMGFSVGSDISQVLNKIKQVANVSVNIKDANGKNITSGKIKTGYTVIINNGSDTTLKTVLYGDVTGDGTINSADYIAIKNIIMKRSSYSDAAQKAADADKNGSVGSSDYIKVKNYIMNRGTIEQ